jgi:predicted TIM-barrel fold metal-dependent hydrolase
MTCVDASLVLGFRSERLGARVPNELIADFVGRDPRKRIGIAGIDPLSADCLDQVDRAVELGLVGITVSPACQGFHPLHSEAMRVYDRCAELAMPVLVQNLEPLTSSAVLDFGRPVLWDEVARSFPSLRLVIGQLGFPWIDETLVLVAKHANVYSDISGVGSRPWQLYTAMLNASAMGVMDKLLFGSGFPFESPARIIEALYSLNAYSHGTQLPSIPRSQIRGIVERDSLNCLGIEVELPQRRSETTLGLDMDLPAVEMGEMLDRRHASMPGVRSGARRPV